MEAKAIARHVRVTPRKARRMVDLIRGKKATEAITILKFAPQDASLRVGLSTGSRIGSRLIGRSPNERALLDASAIGAGDHTVAAASVHAELRRRTQLDWRQPSGH